MCAREAFESHDAFEYHEERAVATATPFDAHASAEDDQFEVVVELPTLSAVVEGPVGDAVAEGWFETLERRLEDAYDVTRSGEGQTAVEHDETVVRVTFTFAAPPNPGVDDAAALVDFVEGTYVQGVIPGYDYRDPVASLLEEARQRGQGDPGGTPI